MMYERADESNVAELLSFFEKDLTNCLYSYIDLEKYGIHNQDLTIYLYKENGNLIAVATKYFNGLQLFHYETPFPVEATISLINQIKPSIISSTLDVIDSLAPFLSSCYEIEKGYVTSLKETLHKDYSYNVEKATLNDLEEIATLICLDEGLGGHYTIEELTNQLSTRMREKFGRNYIIRENNKIICHAATYAEINNLAVISGVITHPAYRGKGYAIDLVSKLCSDLLMEGKQPHLFYYTEASESLYRKIGFHSPSNWGKLVKQNH